MSEKGWMMMRYFWFSFLAALMFFLVNLIGFIDTMTQSAMGCGTGYPFCNGSIFPNFHDIHSMIEYTHRMVVGLASLLAFSVSIVAWIRYKKPVMKWLVFFVIIGILGESTLGALTVIISLSPYLLAAHLGLALISFSALTNMAYVIYLEEKKKEFSGFVPTSFSLYSWVTFVILYLAVYFGGYVAKTGSGALFKGFPLPTETLSQAGYAFWVDVIHRSFAILLVILFFFLMTFAQKIRSIRPDFYRFSCLCFILILLQGLSGWYLIYTHLRLGAVLLHVSDLSLLVGSLSVICVQSISIKK